LHRYVAGGFNAKTMCDRRRYEYVIPVKAGGCTSRIQS
jgi:tRNA U38,U39,U40 pseudouridine synthase TruA